MSKNRKNGVVCINLNQFSLYHSRLNHKLISLRLTFGVGKSIVEAVGLSVAATSIHDSVISFLSGVWAGLEGCVCPAGFAVVGSGVPRVGAQ